MSIATGTNFLQTGALALMRHLLRRSVQGLVLCSTKLGRVCNHVSGPTLAASPLMLRRNTHLQLLLIYTALESVFSTLYFLIVQRLDKTLLIGALLYAVLAALLFAAGRRQQRRQQKQRLLDALTLS